MKQKKIMNSEECNDVVSDFLTFFSARKRWTDTAIDLDEFYHNEHYTDSQKVEIQERGQFPLAINILYPIIRQQISMLASVHPKWNVTPVSDTNKAEAYILRAILEHSWKLSGAANEYPRIVKDQLVVGVGYGYVEPFYQDQQFQVAFKRIPWVNVFPYPGTSSQNWDDCDAVVIGKLMSIKQAARFFDLTEDEVKEHNTQFQTWVNNSDEQTLKQKWWSLNADIESVNVCEHLTLEERTIYAVTPKVENMQISTKIYTDYDEKKGLVKSGMREWEVPTDSWDVKSEKKRVLVRRRVLGDYGEEEVLPIDTFNIRPFYFEHRDTPYPLGQESFLIDINRVVDKFVMLSILNAQLQNNMRIVAEEGSILDEEKWKQGYSIPGSINSWRRISEETQEPKVVAPLPLGSEFLQFPMGMLKLAEYISGVYSVMQGNPAEAPRTASGLSSLQSYGSMKMKLLGADNEVVLSQLGDVAVQFIQNYAPHNVVFTYREGNQFKDIAFNTLESMHDGKGGIAMRNDLSAGKFRVYATIIQDMGSERFMKAKILADLAAQTKSPELIAPILKLADIPEADIIANKLDVEQKLRGQIQQLQQENQRLNQIRMQQENELIRKNRKVADAEYRTNLNKMIGQAEGDLKLAAGSIPRVEEQGETEGATAAPPEYQE